MGYCSCGHKESDTTEQLNNVPIYIYTHIHIHIYIQEYWSGLPLSSPGDLPNPGIEPGSPALEADAFTSEPQTASFYNNVF